MALREDRALVGVVLATLDLDGQSRAQTLTLREALKCRLLRLEA